MKTEDIVKAAEERLAEIEAEAKKLRAIISAAKGPSIGPFIPMPVLPPVEVFPFPGPYSQERPIEYEWHRIAKKSRVITSWEVTPVFGVRQNEDGCDFVIGGPQHGDPHVRFAH